MNKGMELVRTINWKVEVKQGEVFETPDMVGEWLLRAYKGSFEKVEDKEVEEKKEEKAEKKAEWKKTKAKK